MADVVLLKVASIERCLKRIREENDCPWERLTRNFTKQDAIILNLQRACEQSIDLANHIIKSSRWGFPEASRDSFQILVQRGFLSKKLGDRMQGMVGFRNLAVHEYQSLDLHVLKSILDDHLSDFEDFRTACLKWNNEGSFGDETVK